tara:strand:+ start:399 stop:617 length:219 start_codon:yes stop_codon:yes gene_type:complete
MANLNNLSGEISGQVISYMLNRFNPVVDELERVKSILNALKSGEIELWQVIPTEAGNFDILPAPPVAETENS